MILDTQYVREQLERRQRERQLTKVAKLTGFSVRVLQYIISGERVGHLETWEKLQRFFIRTETLGLLPDEMKGEEPK